MTDAQLAAGALVWRRAEAGVEVLLVERTQHRDMSLPKGKLDPGEALPECAVREIHEETGIRISLGAPLGTSEYRLPNGRDKVVYYWQAEATEGAIAESSFAPNDEIAELSWLSLAAAKEAVSYTHDVRIIERFEQRLADGCETTFPIIAVRHGKAADPFSWDGPDASRALTERGQQQARLIAHSIAAFGPRRIITSTAVRCEQTVAPLAALLHKDPKHSTAISQDDYSMHRDVVARMIGKAVRKRRGTVLCSHGPVIPSIITAVVHETEATENETLHRASMLHTADFTVMHVCAGETPTLVAVETHGAPAGI